MEKENEVSPSTVVNLENIIADLQDRIDELEKENADLRYELDELKLRN